MKIYIVVFTSYNSWGEIQKRFNLECYKDRARANNRLDLEALTYARDGYTVSFGDDGFYINMMKAERKNSKICEEEIIEITIREMEVI